MRAASDAMLMLGAAILMVAALWHGYWVSGGRKGLVRAIPVRNGAPIIVPGRVLTAAVALVVAAVAGLYAAVGGLVGLAWLTPSACAILIGLAGLVFVLRAVGDFQHVGFFNRGGLTPFAVADRKVYSPLCLFLGLVGMHAAALRLL